VVVLLPGLPLGLLIEGVEALTGVLLPATSVFLVLLCNDRAVLGPWVNQTWKNIVTGIVVWVLLLLSFASGASTLFPELPAAMIEIGLVIGAGIGLAAAALVGVVRWWTVRAECKALRDQDRLAWRTPALADLTRPELSPLRRAGLITLRAYLLIAAALVIIKVAQLALGAGSDPVPGSESVLVFCCSYYPGSGSAN
jgi:hypothetical protein